MCTDSTFPDNEVRDCGLTCGSCRYQELPPPELPPPPPPSEKPQSLEPLEPLEWAHPDEPDVDHDDADDVAPPIARIVTTATRARIGTIPKTDRAPRGSGEGAATGPLSAGTGLGSVTVPLG